MLESGKVSELELYTLLCLSEGPTHGLGIARWLFENIGLYTSPGTLYPLIKRMAKAGWIREGEGPEPVDGNAKRRRYMALEAAGLNILQNEAERMEKVLGMVRKIKG